MIGTRVLCLVRPRPMLMMFGVSTRQFSMRAVSVKRSRQQWQWNGSEGSNWRPSNWWLLAPLPIAFAATEALQHEKVEKNTKLTFPDALHGVPFVSASQRTVTFLRFSAYAIAFYADVSPADDAVVRTNDEKALLEHVLQHAERIAMRLRPTRETVGGHLIDAWVPKIAQRLPNADARKDALEMLEKIVGSKKKYAQHDNLDVVFDRKDSTLKIYHQDQQLGVVRDADVASTFFRIYLDANSTLTEMKRDFAAGIQQNARQVPPTKTTAASSK